MAALTHRITALWQATLRGDVRWLRYLLVSVVALIADTGLFLIFWSMGIGAVAASACGYSFGILVHWLASSRVV
ncbi:MAG: hypothetical protein ABL874_10345, partial [Sphingopyxis sp.]